jgi:DNA-directed RNA polymerase specialized sigma24 family protein
VFVRPSSVETALALAVTQDLATLRRRAALCRSDPEHLASECLVHLIRRANRRRDDATMNAMFVVLLTRCEWILKAKVQDGAFVDAEALREDILGAFGELLGADGTGDDPDALDFYECRFNRAFACLRIDMVRTERTRLEHVARLPSGRDDDGEPHVDDDAFARVSEAFRVRPDQEDAVFRAELHEAIGALPPTERDAVVLVHALGYVEESDDPDTVTAATRCGVSGRTIRKRLARAAGKLARFRKET